jgi:tripartite-type tricarboxylate transporter receptor subunit TctC
MSMNLLRVVTILAALAVPGLATAQDYPRQTVKLLVGFLAGGPIDTTARIMAESLSQIWGVPVIVENRPGANSRIAIEQLRGAQPDGYTLLVGTNGAMTVNPPLQGLTFDQALRGITPVAFTVDYAYQVVTSVEKPYKTIADLVKAAKEKPGTLTYSSPGIGAVNHVAVEDFAMRAGISVINVPYNGDAGSLTDLVAGRVDFSFNSAAQPLVRQGKLRALAATGRQRMKEFPDVPTMIEAGYLDFVVTPWSAVFAPENLPAPLIARISADVKTALEKPEVQRRLTELGFNTMAMSPDELRKWMHKDFDRWAEIGKGANIKLDPVK